MLGPLRQSQIFVSGISGERPRVPVDVATLEQRAMARMSPRAAAYVAGGAGTEATVRSNRVAFDQWRIVPRVLRDVEHRDISISLLGLRLPAPVLLAPIGVLELAHRDADVAVARAAHREHVPMIFSNQASIPMEVCASVMGDTPRLFQLYWSRSDDLVRSFVRRAEQCGCSGIVLTLDTTMLGWRPRDLDLAYLPFLRGRGIAQYTSDPVFLRELLLPPDAPAPTTRLSLASLNALRELLSVSPGSIRSKLKGMWPRQAVRRFVSTYSRPSLQWRDLATLRAMTRLPIILKGILHPDDARRAIDEGMDGIVVSNHGGRQVDGAIASLDALPAIVDAVESRIPVLLDSGIRTGADMYKAIALGASAVMLGRPYVYGLALGGESGVREVIRNLLAEFDVTMGLAGRTSIAEISRNDLVRASGN